MTDGAFEPVETALTLSRLASTDVFIDVGAYVGFYACLARSHSVRTIAVEPHPLNLRRLYDNLHQNGWHDVEVFPVGLGATPGLVPLYGDGTGASVVQGWAQTTSPHRRLVPLLTLDLIIGSRFRDERVFIKVDVEGSEKNVLLGASDTLKYLQKATWLLELCLMENHPTGINPDFADVFETFWSAGYEAWTIDQPRRKVERVDVLRWIERRMRDFGSYNLLFERA
jgi:FkbM family methyltransferase